MNRLITRKPHSAIRFKMNQSRIWSGLVLHLQKKTLWKSFYLWRKWHHWIQWRSFLKSRMKNDPSKLCFFSAWRPIAVSMKKAIYVPDKMKQGFITSFESRLSLRVIPSWLNEQISRLLVTFRQLTNPPPPSCTQCACASIIGGDWTKDSDLISRYNIAKYGDT